MSKIIDAIKETLLPSIPHLSEDDAKDPRLVAQAVESLKEILEVRLGQRGDKLDQSPTWRDLYNNGTIDVIIKGAVLSNAGTNTELPTTGTVNDAVVPPAPTGLSVNAAHTGIIISWDAPSYSNHSYTEIWRCDSDDIGQASFLGTATSQVYSDSVGYAETKYYWIRFVSKSGITGVYNATSGESGTTSINIAAVMVDLNEKIGHSSLSTTLLGTINTTFTQASAPTTKPDGRSLVAGDTWYDSNDKNKLYRYNGSAWADVRDTDIAQALSDAGTAQSTADGKVEFYYSSTEPTGLVATDVGDMWIHTGDDNKLHRWQDVNGTYTWVDIQDGGIGEAISNASTAQSTADGKIDSFFQDNAPTTGMSEGDLWIDTNDGNNQYRHNGTTWVDIQDTAIATAQGSADGKIRSYFQSSSPTGLSSSDDGDLWFDDDKKMHRWQEVSGTYQWVAIPDSDIATAISDASTAQSTADGKITTFYQAAQPTAQSTGDFWVDTDDGDKIYRYSGSSWVALALANEAYVGTEITEQVGYCELTASNGDKTVATGLTTKTACEAATPPSGGSYSWKDSGSIASEVKTVTTTVGSNTSSIATHTLSIAGISAENYVKVDVNGNVAGYGIYGSSTSSEFAVNAGVFKIADGSSSVQPFAVITGAGLTVALNGTQYTNTTQAWQQSNHPTGRWFAAGTYIDTALIAEASIDAAKIHNLTVDFANVTGTLTASQVSAITVTGSMIAASQTIVSPTIYGGTITAGTSLTSPVINGGTITGALVLSGSTGLITEAGGSHYGYNTAVTMDVTATSTAATTQAQGNIKPYNYQYTTPPSPALKSPASNLWRYRRQNVSPDLSGSVYITNVGGLINSNGNSTQTHCTVTIKLREKVSGTVRSTKAFNINSFNSGDDATKTLTLTGSNGGYSYTLIHQYRTETGSDGHTTYYYHRMVPHTMTFTATPTGTVAFNDSTSTGMVAEVVISNIATAYASVGNRTIRIQDTAVNDY